MSATLPKVHYTWRVHHRPGSHALVRLNGLPLYDRTVDDLTSPTGPITHALLPGENKIEITLLDGPPDPTGVPTNLAFILARLERPDPVDVWTFEFPRTLQESGVAPTMPWVEEFVFTPQGAPPPLPTYTESPPSMFPNEGSPGQHQALRELYDAFAGKDGDAFQEAMRIRMDEFERAYGENPQLRAESVQALQEPWIMDPWNPEELRFERWLDGRVAFARRLSGKPAIQAIHRDDPFRSWGADFFLCQVNGRWRVFR